MSLYLRGINLDDVQAKMLSGYYATVPFPQLAARLVVPKKERTRFLKLTDRSNREIVIVPANDVEGEYPCFVCHTPFSHQPLGIPISVKVTSDVIYVTTVDRTCWFPCSKWRLKQLAPRSRMANTMYDDSELLLNQLYRLCGGVGPIPDIPDPSLLCTNGGGLSREDFFSGQGNYSRCPHLIVDQAGVQYQYSLN